MRSLPVTRFVSSSTDNGRSPNRFPAGTSNPDSIRRTLVACCSASTSVGAISAPWCPPSTAASNAVTATTVLPDPTSPCNSRCIGCGAARSWEISVITRSWAAVRGKASASWNRRTSSPSTTWEMPTDSRSIARLRITSASWTRSNSSKASRRRAWSFSRNDSGAWICHRARSRSINPSRRRTAPGTGSQKPLGRERSSAFSTQPASSHVVICAFSLCG